MVLNKIKISPRKLKYILIAAVLVVIIVVAVTLVFVFRAKEDEVTKFRGAVVTNGIECSQIAVNIMQKGGTVADGALAALFCEGITMPSAMGLGGGFLLTLYNRTTRQAVSLNSREVAPKAATQNMFGADANLSLRGGLSVAVFGELRGYWELYKHYGGGVSWKEIIQPSIDMCKNGITVTNFVARALQKYKVTVLANQLLSESFTNPVTNDVLVEGDTFFLPRLVKTLEIIAEEGGDTLNNGSLTSGLVEDIKNHQGIITIEDMNDYKPQWQTPINTTLSGGHTVYTQPLPGSGSVLTLILNILDTFLDLNHPEIIENYQKIIESFKFAYAKRSLLGDSDFVDVAKLVSDLSSKDYAKSLRKLISLNSTQTDASYYGANTTLPEDHGTAHLCILSPNGDAISVTSTINYVFGAGFVSESTGIILNDEMDDFSSDSIVNVYDLPPSPTNYIKPGKRPMSSTSPTIIVNEHGDVEMMTGAAGGSKIISSIAQLIIRYIWYGSDLKETMDAKRIHHQLWPMRVDLEPEFETEDTYVAEGLRKIGHNVTFVVGTGFSAATSIGNRDGKSVVGAYDRRRSGSVSYL